MTLAIWFFWHSKNKDMNTVYIYFIHIVFNTTWSIVFFGLHQISLALIVLLVLIFLIIILILRFKRVNLVSYYLMMTLAIWFFWHSKNRDMNTIYIYFIHIVFNTTWSIVFFGLHKIFLALIVLLILIFLIIILILRFKRVNLVSYYLMIPYLLWTTYALFLNLNLLILN